MIGQIWEALYGESLESKTRGNRSSVLVSCPFHFEKTGSCNVDLKKNVFHCFGCGAQGGYLDLVVRAGFAATRREAAAWLERRGIRR
jgi:hypothetical protein